MKKLFFPVLKRSFSTVKVTPKICIVGAGPAGFYTAQHLLKHVPSARVDVYEKLPVPFGFGVAPDHPEVKNVINTFTKTARHPNLTFLGNVNLGVDVRLKELREAYHVVLLTYGADENRKLNIPGENLTHVIPARRIVGWYNGIPSDKDLKVDLSKPTVAIFGQGNVAIDVARILLSPIDFLKKTDITQYALDALSESKVKQVSLIGRRGPLQAAFTIKELREILKLPGCNTIWNTNDFTGVKEVIPTLPRPRKRITELMCKSVESPNVSSDGNKVLKIVFYRSPIEIEGSNKVRLGINKLVNDKAVSTNEVEYLNCDLVVTSIGYKSVQVDSDIPFDNKVGIAKNNNGKISDGLYTTGWLGTGPTGVILTTMGNAFATGELIKEDLTKLTPTYKPGSKQILDILKDRGVRTVSWADWEKIDKYEQEQGKKLGKPREKVVEVSKMLEIVD